jgi:integrase
MSSRLTDRMIGELPAPERGNKIYYDSPTEKGKDWTPGFGIRVTAAGAKAFVLSYRTTAGRDRRMTIGTPPTWSLASARDEAATLKRRIDVGEDPLGEAKATRGAPTVADLCDRYAEDELPKKRESTQSDYLSMIANEVKPQLGSLKVADVTFSDIDRVHRKITKRAPYAANRAVALLSRLFNFAIRWQMRSDNPAKGIERNQEHKRERYLSADELIRLSAALAEHDDKDAANIIRLLLLTGARKGEVLSARWDQFDLDEGVWTKPAASTKQKTAHRIPLSAPARQILVAVRRKAAGEVNSEFLFPGRFAGHRENVKDNWGSICKTAKISGARIHDLRHTYASVLASAGQSLPIIGALLGHTQPSTTARYAHLLDDPLRKATERAGVIVTGKKRPGAKVVSLRGAHAD